ncbi:unnamed protein product [Coffea canephora]|uniref:DH200=94 genomic scaffold, scaffold_2856 n=1 Tax=Coffea canephora TaxID=49390 RepID=A0A068VKK8_COFCA|nr:unnamed protein product [Coffea canephora]
MNSLGSCIFKSTLPFYTLITLSFFLPFCTRAPLCFFTCTRTLLSSLAHMHFILSFHIPYLAHSRAHFHLHIYCFL